jgi:hypothetical protein
MVEKKDPTEIAGGLLIREKKQLQQWSEQWILNEE